TYCKYVGTIAGCHPVAAGLVKHERPCRAGVPEALLQLTSIKYHENACPGCDTCTRRCPPLDRALAHWHTPGDSDSIKRTCPTGTPVKTPAQVQEDRGTGGKFRGPAPVSSTPI